MAASDYIRYADANYNGEKYRAVVFDGYRPCYTGYISSVPESYQDDKGGNIKITRHTNRKREFARR